MAYSTQADVQTAAGGAKRFLQLADWDNTNAIDAAVVTAAIAKADALIDSFASKRFTVPFNPVPEIIKQHSADLAKLIIVKRRGVLDDDQQREWDSIAGTETGKEGWLLKMAQGVVTPGGDPLPPKHSTMAVDSVDATLPDDRDISREKLGGYW
jgi:phage gp36-like protein